MAVEGAAAAKGLVDALKNRPLVLSLVLMNLGLLGFLYYWGVQAHQERQEELKLLYQNRKEVADLLFRCYPAPPASNLGG